MYFKMIKLIIQVDTRVHGKYENVYKCILGLAINV